MITSRYIPFRFILKHTKISIITILIIVFAVWGIEQFTHFPEIPISIPAFLGTSIALVLGFKLSQSYDRWWEARKVWGAIVNDSRTLVVQAKSFTKQNPDDETIRRITLRQVAWCYSLGQSLRKLPPTANIEEYLSSEELEEISKHSNVPLALVDKHAADVTKLASEEKINNYQQMQMDATLVRLVESMGKAERIKNTVFPTAYKLFLHFFIFLFIVFLSISLIETGGAKSIPILFFISLPFVLLEMTATLLQDPFENKPTDISVTALARTIEINLKQLIKEPNIPVPMKPNRFYIN